MLVSGFLFRWFHGFLFRWFAVFLLLGFLFPVRNKQQHHASTLHPGGLVDSSNIGDMFHETAQKFLTLFDACDLSALEDNGRLHFVPVCKKLVCMSCLEIKVVRISVRMKAELLQNGHMLMFLLELVFLRLFILELPKTDDLAHWRFRTGDDFHQIGLTLQGKPDRFPWCHHSKLCTMVVDNPDFRSPDLIINAGSLFFGYGWSPSFVAVLC